MSISNRTSDDGAPKAGLGSDVSNPISRATED